ncbi:MAG: EAL domain-containing protein [Candidatus Nanopelagicales bacterium]|nr:EAL domain-containing protein [Candidatus Nanopelagicales bacterium]MDZ4248475.1 EAL domain-containing protein [Candidatus Nanopelagicales bacterium]
MKPPEIPGASRVRLPPLGPVAAAFLGLGLLGGTAYVILPQTPWSSMLLYNGPVAIALGVAASGVIRWRGTDRQIAFFISLSIAAFLDGELLWSWMTANDEDPFPSIADGLYLAGYIPLAIAALILAARRRREPDPSAGLDAAIVTLSAGAALYLVLIEPYASDTMIPASEKAILVAYPLADLVIIGTVMWLLVAQAARGWATILFCGGLVFTLIADFAYAWLEINSEYEEGSILDLAWILGYLSLAAAAACRPQPAVPMAKPRPGRMRLLAVLVAVLVPLVVLLVNLASLRGVQVHTAVATVLILAAVMALVVARMWWLVGRAHVVEQHLAEERLSSVIHHSADSIVLIDDDLSIIYASPSVGNLAGVDPESDVGSPLSTLFVEADRVGLNQQLTDLATMPVGCVIPLEGRIQSPSGEDRIVEGTASNLLDDQTVAACVVTLRDVTVRHSLEDQLEKKALYDSLTGLANRALFMDRLGTALRKLDAHPEAGVAVLYIDLDDFKAVNDGLGRMAGDELLQHVARRLRTFLHSTDSIARLGGDEFAILLDEAGSESSVVDFANRVSEVLRVPAKLQGITLRVSVSIGVGMATPGSSAESLLRNADLARYSAKGRGGGQVVLFDGHLRDVAADRLALKVSLAEALASSQMRVAYQPIFRAGGDHRLCGFEALLRWEHPTRGQVSPEEFIPVAEASGDIVELDRWVLEQACVQAVAWNGSSEHRLTMNVNVSAVEFARDGFARRVRTALKSTGLSASLLTLELTESVMAEAQIVERVLAKLRKIGVGIAIDDFGTGFSSLAYLQRFPVTTLKIDRSFVSRMSSESDNSLVRSIIAIADALDLKSVAEGVDTLEQLNELDRLGCRFVQGFYLGRPQFPEELEELVSEGSGKTL